MTAPIVEHHGRWAVVRDDLIPGGTKARALPAMMAGAAAVAYAGPAWGGAAYAIAHAGRELGVAVTLFYPARAALLPRQRLCESLGARIVAVPAGRLSVLRARARVHCAASGARLLQWGLPGAVAAIESAARDAYAAAPDTDEVWCAAGSGTLARGLCAGFRGVPCVAVQVGAAVGGAAIGCRVVAAPVAFGVREPGAVPFDSCRYYCAKAWAAGVRLSKAKHPLFWNVMGDHQ